MAKTLILKCSFHYLIGVLSCLSKFHIELEEHIHKNYVILFFYRYQGTMFTLSVLSYKASKFLKMMPEKPKVSS